MKPVTGWRYRHALLGFILVLLGFLIVANVLLVTAQRDILLQEAHRHANDELDLVATFAREALIKHDYQTIEQFLNQWADEHTSIVELKATVPNSFLLIHYQRAQPTEYPLTLTHPVAFNGQTLLDLELVKDLAPVERGLVKMRLELITASILFVIILGLLLWTTIQRIALIPLARTEALLSQQRDHLDSTVQARTASLTENNIKLQQYIHEHKRVERELREERNFVSAILNTVGALICVLDKKGRIVRFNRACEKTTGYTSDEVRGKFVWDLFIIPEQMEGVRAVFKELRSGVFAKQYENHWVTKNGERRLIRWSNTSLLDAQETPEYIIGTGIDITEHRQAEVALLQAQKMDALGQLTGGVAHDFNNLLTVISGNLQILEQYPTDDQFRHKLIQAAQNATRRGADLIHKLLIFSHREDLRPQVIDLNQLVGDMILLLHRTLGENIEIETQKEASLWKTQADPSQLETSLLNLAVNARDAMPGGGKLTIETANIRLDEEYATRHHELRPGDYVMLAVSDTGTGMTTEVIEHAFDPFYTTKKVGKGSGLGLSMVYGFVKQSSGHIKIYSELGYGTSVKIYLPKTENLQSVSPSSSLSPYTISAQGEKVLVVEDDDDVRELARIFLTEMGFDVLDAAEGRQAIEILKQVQNIDILFVDLVMPGGKSGLQVAQEAKHLCPAIKVLYTSGYGNNAIHHHGQFNQDTYILGKPYDREKLARAINQLIEDSAKE